MAAMRCYYTPTGLQQSLYDAKSNMVVPIFGLEPYSPLLLFCTICFRTMWSWTFDNLEEIIRNACGSVLFKYDPGMDLE